MSKTKVTDINKEDETDAKEVEYKSYKKPIYSKIERILSEEDIKNPAIIKLILDDNELLKDQIDNINEYVFKFHNTDKELAVYQEREKKNIGYEILHDLCIALGGLLFGFVALDFTKPIAMNNYLFLLLGLIFIVGASISKWRKN